MLSTGRGSKSSSGLTVRKLARGLLLDYTPPRRPSASLDSSSNGTKNTTESHRRKRSRILVYSPPSRKVREDELDRITKCVLAALKECLSQDYLLNLQLPSPDDLQFDFEAPPIDDDGAFFNEIPADTQFLLAVIREAEGYGKQFRQIIALAHPCSCADRFFLPQTRPPRKNILDKLREHPDHLERIENLLKYGIKGKRAGPPFDSSSESPYQSAVEEGFVQFQKTVKEGNQRINAIAAICSPSTYLEGLLHCRCDESLWENHAAQQYFKHHQDILNFQSEILALVKRGIERERIYDLLYPLYDELTPIRGFPPLPETHR